MLLSTDDTIAALASAPGGAWRGIVRLSGPAVAECLARCFVANDPPPTPPRRPTALAGVLRLPPPCGELPTDLYLWPTERSYTRQPLAELHTIGSPPLLDAALRAVCAAGARIAEPGEFTLRAFLAGRLDLTQAEAVLGVIDAASHAELDVALRQLAGGLAAPLQALRDELLNVLAHLEAGLDFVEEDIEFISPHELDAQLAHASERVAQLLEQMTTRGDAAHEFRVVLAGWPNVGKSSLLNALVGEAAAIVSDRPGTTRDYIARRLNIHGHECLLIDTAGIEPQQQRPQSKPSVASAAQSMTRQQHTAAHLRLLCLDATRSLNAWEQSELAAPNRPPTLIVATKTDSPPAPADIRLPPFPPDAIRTSSRTSDGLQDLQAAIVRHLLSASTSETHVVAGTAARCQESLRLAHESLARARHIATNALGEELVAAELRTALDELGQVAGAVYTDDILDRIFSRFCIGK